MPEFIAATIKTDIKEVLADEQSLSAPSVIR
jgi:hypothetical protein